MVVPGSSRSLLEESSHDARAIRPIPRRFRARGSVSARRARRDTALTVHFETKIAIVLDEQLAVWQKANVTAFLISGIAVAPVAATDLDLAGIALHANRRTVDKVLDKLRPHP